MTNKAKRIEVRTADDKVLFTFYLTEEEISNYYKPGKKPGNAKEKKEGNLGIKTEEPMTDAQKRYLFRILADQGIEEDNALKHLKDLFQVNSLKEVSKLEASRAIENMLAEAKGGEAHESPFE